MQIKNINKLLVGVVSLCFILTGLVQATAFTQGYQTKTTLSQGMAVAISKDGGNMVEPATLETDSALVGITTETAAIIDLQPKASNIRIAISGNAQLLVSTSAGDIKKGDYLVISPLDGITEKNSPKTKATKYVAVAGADFSSKSDGAKQVSVKLTDGSNKDVYIGTIDGNVILANRPAGQEQQSNSLLAKLGEKITGRQVSSLRVIASVVVLISVFTVTGWMLNASIKGSFISLGRNPLARVSILTNLMRVIAIALVVFGVGLAASYLVLVL